MAKKRYELLNHLGNVMGVVTDRRFVQNGSVFAIAEVVSATDYYPFGMEMPGRVFAGSRYGFGFNTQMKSPEILPGHTTAQFWEYDSRIGRRWELDPKTVTGWSGYACLGDSPILMVDWNGEIPIPISAKEFRQFANRMGITTNKKIGAFYEDLVMATIRTTHTHVIPNSRTNYSSTYRKGKNYPNGPNKVRPDGISFRPKINTTNIGDSNLTLPAFYEAKVTEVGVLSRNYRKSQISGMIDALAILRDERGKSSDRAALTLILTNNTKLSEDLLVFAHERKVDIYISIAAIDDETGEFTISDPKLANGIDLTSLFDVDNFEDFKSIKPASYATPYQQFPVDVSDTGDPDQATYETND